MQKGQEKFSQWDEFSCFEKKYCNIFLDLRTYFSNQENVSQKFQVFQSELTLEQIEHLHTMCMVRE